MKRRDFLKYCIVTTGSLGAMSATGCAVSANNTAADIKKRPNIVLIYGDDIGYGDFSCYGTKSVSTPNIDRLAQKGLQFTSGYCTSATCTPSRYSMLTGEYAWRKRGAHILQGDAPALIRPGRTTLPSILKKAGYKTAVVGKWHLGLGDGKKPLDWNKDIKPGPLEIGFDYSFLIPATGDRVPCVYVENHNVANLDPNDPISVSYKKPFPGEPTGRTDRDKLKMDWSHGHNMAVINGVGRIGYMKGGKSALWDDETIADELVSKAKNFIDKNKHRPFFLYFATHDIHVPRLPNPRFAGKSGMGPRGDAIVQFDWCVGELVKKINELGLTEDTMIIVTSDNGPVLDDGYKDQAKKKLGDHKPAGPLRGGKYSFFEGGTRVPFIVTWPGTVEPDRSDAIVSQVDFGASFAELTGQELDYDAMPDSFNVLDALLGRSKTGREYVIEQAGALAVRKGDWKYIESKKSRRRKGKAMLFHLNDDLGESTNVIAKYPRKAAEMAEFLRKIKSSSRTR